MSEQRKHVILYTDGGCEPNPGPGGYGIVLVYGSHHKQVSGGFQYTTNNRMEIMAAIKGLEMLKEPCEVTVISDSQYLVKAMTEGWVQRWQSKNWKKSGAEVVPNVELWKRLLDLCSIHSVTFQWIKGHAGHPENELCDQLALDALRQTGLPVDEGYLSMPKVSQINSGDAVSPNSPPTQKTHQPVEGGACPKCGSVLERRKTQQKPKPGQTYRYEYILHCSGCQRIFVVEDAKRPVEASSTSLSLFG